MISGSRPTAFLKRWVASTHVIDATRLVPPRMPCQLAAAQSQGTKRLPFCLSAAKHGFCTAPTQATSFLLVWNLSELAPPPKQKTASLLDHGAKR